MSTEAVVIDESVRSRIEVPPAGALINGRWQEAASGARFDVIDPATEKTIGQAARCGPEDVTSAVAAARQAVDGDAWSRLSGTERGRLLYRLADLIERDTERFTELDALDMGQPVKAAMMAAAAFRYYAGWADKIVGYQVDLPGADARPVHAYIRREPVGVVAAITPWNAPLMIAAWKLAPALAAGCSTILKPPEDAPLSSLHLGRLAIEAGFPGGALNIIPGLGSEAGASLVTAPGVDKVTYTGGTPVGRQVGAAASSQLKYVTLELGGKSPQIIFADADIDSALPTAARQIYANSGQVCVAGTRILVERKVADRVIAGLSEQFQQVQVGDPFSRTTQIGALISRRQLDRVTGFVDEGRRGGAELVTGGSRIGSRGFFLEPTLFTGTNDMTIAQEEIFGPVGVVVTFDTFDEAIEIANATAYGLAATVYTTNLSTAHTAAAAIKAGMVRVNGNAGVPSPLLPQGGMKGSGVGRELGLAGIEECTVDKTVCIQL
jgi:betaine-aldehyde dehydrogenase